MKHNKKFYYNSENDEVLNFKNKPIKIDGNYEYIIRNPLKKFLSWLTYYFIAVPFAFVTFKLIKRIKFHNKNILKPYKNSGFFIYANHTNQFCDGFCPGLVCFPQKAHIIINSANLTTPIVGKFVKMWGGLPLPNTIEATKNFYHAIEDISKKNPIIIYPEAHLWPYYTKIRNFPSSSFKYPIKFNKPTFTFTTVYKKRNHSKKPKIEIYIDGPFSVNKNLDDKFQQEELRNIIHKHLSNRANLSNCEYIKYIKRSNHD